MSRFQKSTYTLGDPVFVLVSNSRKSEYQLFRTLAGIKQKITGIKRYNPSLSYKVYVCPDPAWFEIDELTQEAIYACDEDTINAEMEKIRQRYGEA